MPSPVYDQGPLKGRPIPGMLQVGNVDVNHRLSIKNADGSSSSIFSMTVPVGKDGSPIPWPKKGQSDPRITGYALVPSIANGKFLTSDGKMPDKAHMGDLEDAATSYYAKTRQHLGIFSSPDAADKYATSNHDYGNDGTAATVYAPSPTQKGSPMPDYAAIAAKHGGTVSAPETDVDYTALAAKHGGTVSQATVPIQQPTATISARPDTLPNWFEDVGNDIKHGTTITGPGKFLHAIGVQPTRTGEPGGSPANLIGNALVGATQIGHAATDPSSPLLLPGARDFNAHKAVQNTNELIKGGMNVAAPVAAVAAPEAILPTVATYGPIGAGVTKAASALGADPDEAELAGNAAMLGTPGIKESLPAVGKFVEKNALTIGKTAGYGGAAYEVATHPTSTNAVMGLLGAHPLARATEAVTGAVGRGLQGIGNTPLLPHEIEGFDGSGVPNNDLVHTVPQAVDAQHFAHNSLGIDLDPNMIPSPSRTLGPGPTEMPAPPEEPAPLIRPAASQIVRGQGGRMTKQYLTGEAQPGAPTQFGAQPPLVPGLGESQVPPPLNPNTAATDTTALAGNGIQPPVQGNSEAPLINIPKAQPLTKEANPDTVNNMPQDMSRRDFLKTGAKAVGAAALPKGPVGDLINTAIGGKSSIAGTGMDMGVGNTPEVRVTSGGVGHFIGPMISKMVDYLNHAHSSDAEDDEEAGGLGGYEPLTPEHFTTTDPSRNLYGQSKVESVVKHGENTLVHMTSDLGDEGGPADVIGEFSPSGQLLRMVHAFDGEAHMAVKGGQVVPTDYEPTPEEETWLNNLSDAQQSGWTEDGGGINSENMIPPEDKSREQPESKSEEPGPEQVAPPERHEVLPGDFSLNTPQRFYHGSPAENLINTGIESRGSGVYLTPHEDIADEFINPFDEENNHGKTYTVDLPRGSRMSLDPEFEEENFAGPDSTAIIHHGDIPSGRVNTQDDLINTHGFQQESRDNLDRGQESADELGRQIFYKNNKPDVSKTTGSRYDPVLPGEDGNTDLLPWAQTPWGSNESATGVLQPKGPQLIQVPEPQIPPGPVFTADELKGLQKTQKPGPKRIK